MPAHHTALSVARPTFIGGGQWIVRKLNAITVLLGRNGSGKSVMLREIRTQDPAKRHYIVPERTGDISFDAGLLLEVIDSGRRAGRSNSNFSASYRQEVVTRIQGYYTRRGTKERAKLDHDPKDMLHLMGFLLPDFTIDVKAENPFYDLIRVRDGANVTSVSGLSSGESQLLSLGLDVLTIAGIWRLDYLKGGMLLIDEPDAHIHPDLQIKLADFLCQVEEKFEVQIVIATHSTTLLAALAQFGGERLSVVYLAGDRTDLPAEPFGPVMKELTAFLGGHLLLGPLFGAPVMLVEGDDDYRVWVHVARGSHAKLCVMPCNGEEIRQYQRTLERLFAALSENTKLRGIALLDGDKPIPQPDANNPQNFVRFHALACHETENLYLSDEVLTTLGFTWEQALQRIVDKAGEYGQKANELRSLATIDRRHGEVKNVIHQVAEILDCKKLLWSMRLGKVLAERPPTGMLRAWLGSCAEFVWPLPLAHLSVDTTSPAAQT